MNGIGQRVAPAIRTKRANLVWRKKPLYDTFLTAAAGAGVAAVPFFAVPRGQIGSGFAVAKTECETNMTGVGQIGDPNQFLLHGFAIEPMFQPQAAAAGAAITAVGDFMAVYNTGIFRFILGQNNVQLEIPVDRIPAGPGAIGGAAVTVGGTPLSMASIHNGTPHIGHFYDFRTHDGQPLLIDGSDTFRCEIIYTGVGGNLITGAGTGVIRIRCYMMGILGEQQ